MTKAAAGTRPGHSDRDAWADKLERELTLVHSVPRELVNRVLAEVAEAVTETEQPAEELFGPAEEYAAVVATERVDVRHRSALDFEGRTPATHFRQGMVAGSIAVLIMTVAGTFSGEELSGASTLLLSLSTSVFVAVGFAVFPALRAAGRTRTAWLHGAGVIAAVGVCLAALPAIRDAHSFPFPRSRRPGAGCCSGSWGRPYPRGW
ncbi:hypothetical protein [Streptomyces hirsutus]|uniref:hypothetical protein n=1 Tax=Streptomyces hirsutus TaxID=35620 RepID=UPI0006E2B97F|nr:hypothetical protein [Streptomyces hirsutus]